MKKTNREKVLELLKSIETGSSAPIAYINANHYTQHNLLARDGLSGFGEVLEGLKDYPEAAKVNTVRVFEDGEYVFAHSEYNFFGEKVAFDIFRFEDGYIVEHWDNMQLSALQPNPSGRTMTDGTLEVNADELPNTEENRTLIENFARDVLLAEYPEALASYFDGDNYIQHNPMASDGLSGFGAYMQELTQSGITLKFTKIHKLLAQGNFVLLITEGLYGEGDGSPTSFYDLFRVENGKIAEHWDVVEAIAARALWQNTNGKFSFL